MANSIGAAVAYLAVLDKLYKAAAKTSVLDVAPALVRASENTGSFYIPKLTLVGAGDYSTSTGFPEGDATLEWVAYTYSQDRARGFTIDAVENMEGAMLAFGNIAAEFQRVHWAPEVDAYRIAKLATGFGTDVAATLSTGAEMAAALNLGYTTMQENEVDDDNLVLFMTPTWANTVRQQVALSAVPVPVLDGAQVIVVPQSRMYTAITQDAGATGSAGGWARTTGAEEVNFILMDKGAAFTDLKHQALRSFSPDVNQDADAWKFQFRSVHECFLYDNKKTTGGYVHTKDATVC